LACSLVYAVHAGEALVVDAGFVLGDVLTCVLKPE